MTDQPKPALRRVRLAWRWKESGISGSGPWTHRSDLVEAWFESMVRRSGERVDHWIEEERFDENDRAHDRLAGSAERDSRGNGRDLSALA
jgi:hypothetical protein